MKFDKVFFYNKLFDFFCNISNDSIEAYEKFRSFRVIYKNIVNGNNHINNIAVFPDNESYGHEYWLKYYSSWEKPIYGLIEHGIYFGRQTEKIGDNRQYDIKSLLTFGEYRESLLHEAFPDYKVVCIGPLIAYANTDENYKSKIITNLKKQDKLATLFPSHSVKTIQTEYDVDELLDKAKKLCEKHEIKNLCVCLGYDDILNGRYKKYEKRGCQIVTAGGVLKDFLPRLRAIIEASSLTMSNNLGTHVGYCIYLKRPHILFKQNIKWTGDKNAIEAVKKRHSSMWDFYFDSEKKSFLDLFSEDKAMNVSEEQYKFCDYYWGFSKVKSAKQLRNIFESMYERRRILF